MKALPPLELSKKIVNLDLSNLPIERDLGVLWDTENDVLQIKSVLKELPSIKRGILSFVSSIFDPLGIVVLAVLEPKLIVQDLWKRKIDWDEDLSDDLLIWNGFHRTENPNVDLHIFADSSKQAYGAVAYFRAENENEINCNFVMGKSRQENALTIPRLELQAAVIASRMKCVITSHISFRVDSVFLLSGSQTVLSYIRNENSRISSYIAHRVNEIRENTRINSWNFIPGQLNVADDSTRYINFGRLTTESRWIKGPEFLRNLRKDWPMKPEIAENHKICPVIKWNHYSSWRKLIRHTAWIIKLKSNWLKWKRGCSSRESFTTLTASDISDTELEVCRISQIESYTNEYRSLKTNNVVSKSSCILLI